MLYEFIFTQTGQILNDLMRWYFSSLKPLIANVNQTLRRDIKCIIWIMGSDWKGALMSWHQPNDDSRCSRKDKKNGERRNRMETRLQVCEKNRDRLNVCFLFSMPLFRLRVNSSILRGKRRITLQLLISCFQNLLFRRLSGIFSPTHWFGVIYSSHRKRHRCSKLSRIV